MRRGGREDRVEVGVFHSDAMRRGTRPAQQDWPGNGRSASIHVVIVDSYRLVRPGSEPAMRGAQRARRAIETGGTVLGVLVGSGAAILTLAITTPAILGRESPLPTWMLLTWPVFIAAVLVISCAIGGWLIALRVAEYRYDRRRDALTRSAFSMYDYWSAIPDLPPIELWALLDRYEREVVAAYADVPSPWDQHPEHL